jgi:hypothetical protein
LRKETLVLIMHAPRKAFNAIQDLLSLWPNPQLMMNLLLCKCAHHVGKWWRYRKQFWSTRVHVDLLMFKMLKFLQVLLWYRKTGSACMASASPESCQVVEKWCGAAQWLYYIAGWFHFPPNRETAFSFSIFSPCSSYNVTVKQFLLVFFNHRLHTLCQWLYNYYGLRKKSPLFQK